MKKFLLHLMCVVSLSLMMTSCIDFNTGDETIEEEVIELTRCWALKSFCGVEAEMDVRINFAKDGNFTIYQRNEALTYTVFNGTYEVDAENSLISGTYEDGTSWVSTYHYIVDVEARELTLESVENLAEVAVYAPSKIPASATTSSTRSASVNDVKPL